MTSELWTITEDTERGAGYYRAYDDDDDDYLALYIAPELAKRTNDDGLSRMLAGALATYRDGSVLPICFGVISVDFDFQRAGASDVISFDLIKD